jgi:hypothetical protein
MAASIKKRKADFGRNPVSSASMSSRTPPFVEELRSLLNTGYKRGAVIPRCVAKNMK